MKRKNKNAVGQAKEGSIHDQEKNQLQLGTEQNTLQPRVEGRI